MSAEIVHYDSRQNISKEKEATTSMSTSSCSEDSPIDVVYGHVIHLPPSTLKQARWKTMSGIELSGYIEIKLPLKERRFGCWKAWKKQWCIIGKNGNKATLQIGLDKCDINTSIVIPDDAILCRTESRSRNYAFGVFCTNMKQRQACVFLAGESETEANKWMTNIRNILKPPLDSCSENEFEISVIDNDHSRVAGLHGLYGRLSVASSEIIIKDPHNNKIKVTWHWSQISHSYLPLPADAEDVHRICTICTSGKFKAGEGELQVFCLKADQLHERLSACPRLSSSASVPRIVTSPLPPTPDSTPPPTPPRNRVNTSPSRLMLPKSLLNTRRMSRSENDLQKFFLQRSLNNFNNGGSQVTSHDLLFLSSTENVAAQKMPSLLLANIGFLISTPGCSEPESLNEPQTMTDAKCQQSTIVASGGEKVEYEMIDEEETEKTNRCLTFFQKSQSHQHLKLERRQQSGEYDEILQPNKFDGDYREIIDKPPPLPPRKSNVKSSCCSNMDDGKRNSKSEHDESFYLPMAPVEPADQKYVLMTNLKDKVFVTKPVAI